MSAAHQTLAQVLRTQQICKKTQQMLAGATVTIKEGKGAEQAQGQAVHGAFTILDNKASPIGDL